MRGQKIKRIDSMVNRWLIYGKKKKNVQTITQIAQSEKHAIEHSSIKSCHVTAEDKQKAWEQLSRYSLSLHTYCIKPPSGT